MIKNICLIIASVLTTCAVFIVTSANNTNLVTTQFVPIIPESVAAKVSIFRMGDQLVISINESTLRIKEHK